LTSNQIILGYNYALAAVAVADLTCITASSQCNEVSSLGKELIKAHFLSNTNGDTVRRIPTVQDPPASPGEHSPRDNCP